VGVRVRWTHVDGWGVGDQFHLDVHRRNFASMIHPLFFSCKEIGVFCTRISSFDGIKSENIS